MTKRRVEMLESTDRQDLISLMWIILQLRDEYLEKQNKDAVEYLQVNIYIKYKSIYIYFA